MEEPGTQQQIQDARQAADADAAQRHPADEASERAQVDYAYSDITDAQAAQLTAQTFAGLLDQPVWQPDLPEGAKIIDYLGTHAALVEPAGSDLQLDPPSGAPTGSPLELGDTGQVLESTMPLRARAESGSLQPIDPTLEDHGNYVEPANAQVETRLPDDLASGIKLQGLGIVVKPAGSSASRDGRDLGGDDYFYPGVDQDTDFIAAPTPLGVETYYLLRSQQSPEDQVIHLDLPQARICDRPTAGSER